MVVGSQHAAAEVDLLADAGGRSEKGDRLLTIGDFRGWCRREQPVAESFATKRRVSLRDQLIERGVAEQIQIVGNWFALRRQLHAGTPARRPNDDRARELRFIHLQPLAKLRDALQSLFVKSDHDDECRDKHRRRDEPRSAGRGVNHSVVRQPDRRQKRGQPQTPKPKVLPASGGQSPRAVVNLLAIPVANAFL